MSGEARGLDCEFVPIVSPSSSRRHLNAVATAIFAFIVWTGIALTVAAPLLAADGRLLGAALIHALFEPVCHQLEHRSFHVAGHPFAVCHRCFGLYLGFGLGFVVLPRMRRAKDWLLDEPRRAIFFILPMGVDWLLPWNIAPSRFGTGLIAALPVAVFMWVAIEELVPRKHLPNRLICPEPSP